ncbi:MAG: carbohydate-binding domain-containing protein [Bacteroidales bacterium]|nr:carbohydate-binding domain-containing protein [Bacteroidales bacterium]
MINKFLNLILLSLLFFAQNSYGRTPADPVSLSISWELMYNFSPGSDHALAHFTLVNKGKTVLNSQNWILYFNMAPRRIIPAGGDQKADVVHINGDWYKLVPRDNFLLKPGHSCTLGFRFAGCMIKESDAPLGLYIVQKEDESGPETIIPVTDYTIKPFLRSEQVSCSDEDDLLPVNVQRMVNYSVNLDTPADSQLLQIIPQPMTVAWGEGTAMIGSDWALIAGAGLDEEKDYLRQKLEAYGRINLLEEDQVAAGTPVIRLAIAENERILHAESYHLAIQDNEISIEGDKAGVFYGIQSLLQLIPFEVIKAKPGSVLLPEVRIEDYPRFAYRGMHIDVCRNFQSKEQLLKVIDLMAMYKLNRLHLYLTEDEAWRLEIPGLPELTDIGSKRGHTLDETDCLPPAYGSGPFADPESSYGTGFYSRDDYMEIIRYADDRHVQVIPSINFPGHARAAIRAMEVRYKKYMEAGDPNRADEFRLIDPDDRSVYSSAQFYNDNIVCVARPSVYHFYEKVIDEVIAMYEEAGVPLDMIHTGGDEVPDGAWTKSPLCDALMADLPEITDPKNLQNYFLEGILQILAERGLKAGGWEEIVLTRDQNWQYQVSDRFLEDQVVPYIWNNLEGSEDLGYRIANAGYQVVLCPVTNLYFDLAYDEDPQEPGLYWGGFNSENDAFEFSPFAMLPDPREMHPGKQFDPAATQGHLVKLEKDKEQNVIGLQGQLWHETIRGGDMMEYALLPKLIAFSERCWAQKPDWEPDRHFPENAAKYHQYRLTFIQKLYLEQLPRLSLVNGGYTYRIPPPGYACDEHGYSARAILPEISIRYTTDGSDPDLNSPLYQKPLNTGAPIKLRCFDRAGRSSRSVEVRFY